MAADRLQLTDADRQELNQSGTQRLLDNRVGWARTYLLKARLLESPRRAIVRITQRGREALSGNARIDSRFLRQFPEFIEFVRGGDGEGIDGGDEKQPIAPPIPPDKTPEELIETGYRQVQSALASDLLERVRAASPRFFEHLVVQLLVAMGYGGSMEDAGKAIGRPDIQQFAGALQGQRARKGVFITTSSFSADAKQYAERIDTRIILIDGTELARLMIAHGVGVTPVAVYELKRVDSDFFAED